MSAVGQSLPKWGVRTTSAFPPIATELRRSRIVSFVPSSDSCTATKWAFRFYRSIPTRLRLTHSFDHLVGNRKQIGREAEKKFGSPLVDNPFELGRLNDQKLSG